MCTFLSAHLSLQAMDPVCLQRIIISVTVGLTQVVAHVKSALFGESSGKACPLPRRIVLLDVLKFAHIALAMGV